MKINKKSYSVVIASAVLILFLIFVSSTASAASPSAITETRITNHGTASNPDIYGDKIVWQDNRNGNWDIYIFDLSTKTEIHTTNKTDQINPAIYENLVVWEDERNGGHDIYVEDLSTKIQTRISKSGEAHNPAIYGNRIVWQEESNGNSNIYMYDISTKKETQITTSGTAYKPDIHGDKIAWSDVEYIIVYDLSNKKETKIPTREFSGYYSPTIYGNWVVWIDANDEYGCVYGVYVMDLSTKKRNELMTFADYMSNPKIYGDNIVYSLAVTGGRYPDVYMYNLSTSEFKEISTSETAEEPDIYGNKIVWVDWRNEGPDIYMATLGSDLPVAAFSASPTSGKTPLNVKFTDTSTGSSTSWFWNFGDGSKSFLQNPVHKYSKAGTYTVKLTVKNAVGRNTVTKADYIKVVTKPVAAFSASPTSGKSPLNVKFTDKSTGIPAKWRWDFGDGTKSFHQNPTHKYSKAGKYTVTLKVTNAAGINTATKSNYITVTAKPVAAFSASPTSGKYPLNVKFTDKSTGSPTKWKWDFGDGTKSFHQNPTHKYSKAGKYTVTLKVTNAVGINTATKSNYITVTGTSQAPTADFWGWPLSGKAPLKVKFTETSKGSPTSWKWDFGDGKYSTEKSPTHMYSSAGTYTVKLIATNAAGSSTKLKWKYIKVAK
ncbi:Chitin binding protein [Methanosarcina barkeri str. Wiesmoor]|uniref:Chitin binding protein n=2 Tax=Methanosarcina barkeri TaxID=2208 RepID=A0A0E3QN06_METBA|nr:PKD domain-containing protein [Methanosarcina barkeri]AKB52508.1 Chitin binding protein [Methanosarcina barkeri str. Wiesmoor]